MTRSWIRTEGDRSEIAFGLLRMCRGRGYTPEQAFELLSQFSNLPVMGHYEEHASGFELSLRADIVRAFTKPVQQSGPVPDVFRAAPEAPLPKPRPEHRQIRIYENYLPMAVDAAETALIEQEVDLFQRGDFIVRPSAAHIMIRGGAEIDSERLYEVRPAELREHLTTCADFLRYDARGVAWKPTNCPEDVARAYLERRGRWRLRYLQGIITAPTLRADGTLLDRPGYDDASRLLFIPAPGAEFPVIPDQPTKADARAALHMLKDLLSTFPFEADADRAVARERHSHGCHSAYPQDCAYACVQRTPARVGQGKARRHRRSDCNRAGGLRHCAGSHRGGDRKTTWRGTTQW